MTKKLIVIFVVALIITTMVNAQKYNAELKITNTPDWLIKQNRITLESDLQLVVYNKPGIEMFSCKDIVFYAVIEGCPSSLSNDYKFMETTYLEQYVNNNLICSNSVNNMFNRINCGTGSLDKIWKIEIRSIYGGHIEPINREFEIISNSKFNDLEESENIKNVSVPLALVLFLIGLILLYYKNKMISIIFLILSFLSAIIPYIIKYLRIR